MPPLPQVLMACWWGDYPPKKPTTSLVLLQGKGLVLIFLLAPTSTPERIAHVARLARGYVYYVSLRGVTGAGHLDVDEVAGKVAAIKVAVPVPVGVGFGIRDGATAKRIGVFADAVVIGSRAGTDDVRCTGGSGSPTLAARGWVKCAKQWMPHSGASLVLNLLQDETPHRSLPVKPVPSRQRRTACD